MESVRAQLESIFRGLIESAIAAIPRILVGIVLVIVAFIAAALIERLLRIALVRLRFDSLVRRTGVDNWLHRAGIRRSIDEFIPRIGYFLLLFIFARTAADSLGLMAISNAIGSVLDYLPKLIAALLILILGSAAAQFVARAVTSAAENTGFQFSKALGNMVAGVTLYVLGVMALSQLEVDTEIIRLVTATVLAGVTLALGLAFGLGSRHAMKNIVAGYYVKKTFRVGEEVEVMGVRGVLAGVNPTQTLLRMEDGVVSIGNQAMLDQMAVRRTPA